MARYRGVYAERRVVYRSISLFFKRKTNESLNQPASGNGGVCAYASGAFKAVSPLHVIAA